jgi:TonB family protein
MKSCKIAVFACVIALAVLGCSGNVRPAPQRAAPTPDSIRELLAVTKIDGLLSESAELGKALIGAKLQQEAATLHPNSKQELIFADFKRQAFSVVDDEFNSIRLEPELIAIFEDFYSQKAVNGLIDFYQTGAGKAVIAKFQQALESNLNNINIGSSVKGSAGEKAFPDKISRDIQTTLWPPEGGGLFALNQLDAGKEIRAAGQKASERFEEVMRARVSELSTRLQPIVKEFQTRLAASVDPGALHALPVAESGLLPPLVPGRTPAKIDQEHPLRIGEDFYPIESRRLNEEGMCVVRVEVDIDGHIRATQLISSSGFERLDAACLAAFADGRLIPATVDGRPVASWAAIPVKWKLSGRDFSAIPQIREDYQLKVGPDFYPGSARERHQEGDCVVHVAVGIDGRAIEAALKKSTGFAALDQACLQAVEQAEFVPARQFGVKLAAWADINISWRLPLQ